MDAHPDFHFLRSLELELGDLSQFSFNVSLPPENNVPENNLLEENVPPQAPQARQPKRRMPYSGNYKMTPSYRKAGQLPVNKKGILAVRCQTKGVLAKTGMCKGKGKLKYLKAIEHLFDIENHLDDVR